jgi:hypothetical protein
MRSSPSWARLRAACLARSGSCCECRGECGQHAHRPCSAPNLGTVVYDGGGGFALADPKSAGATLVVLLLLRSETRGALVVCRRCLLATVRPSSHASRRSRSEARRKSARARLAVSELPHLGQLGLWGE